jgi:hypothetical protein
MIGFVTLKVLRAQITLLILVNLRFSRNRGIAAWMRPE